MLEVFSGIKAIIFDMDGVLFLSTDCHEKAFRKTFAQIGITDFSYASIAGMRTDEAMKKILVDNERPIHEETLKELVERKRRSARELLATYGKVTEGSNELVGRLSQKYRLALASSASPETVRLFLRKSGYADAFEICLDGSIVKEAKPSPEIYLTILKELDLEPKECIVVEDSVSGVQSAERAEIPVIGVTGTESGQKLLEAGAIHTVNDLADIEPILMTIGVCGY